MKNTIIRMSVAALLFLGVATSSQATFIGANNFHSPGGWARLYLRPVPMHRDDWHQSYTGLNNLTNHFVVMLKPDECTDDCEPVTETNGNGSVPEPSIIALFGLGLLGLGFARRRIRH